MTDQSERWGAVADAIRSRMKELRVTKAEVIRASKISDKTLDGYLAGRPIKREDKARGLCIALQWSLDSIDRILAGDEPVTELYFEGAREREIFYGNAPGRSAADDLPDAEVEELEEARLRRRESGDDALDDEGEPSEIRLPRHSSATEAGIIDDLLDWLDESGFPASRLTTTGTGFDAILELPDLQLSVEIALITDRKSERPRLHSALGQLIALNYKLGRSERATITVLLASREPTDREWPEISASVGVITTWPPRFHTLETALTASRVQRGDFAIAAEGAGDAQGQQVGDEVNRPSPPPEPEGP